MILGAEEYAKAIITMLHTYEVDVFKIKEFQLVFKNHKKKHEVATLIELLNIIEPLMEIKEWNYNREKRKKEHQWIDRFILNAIDSLKILSPVVEIGKSIKWWDNADEIKQRGIYVDYYETLFLPKEYSKTDFIQAKSSADRIKRSYRLLNIAFNRLPKIDSDQLIITLNDGINLFIENENKVMLNTEKGR